MQWATWLAGAIGVPLHPSHPVDELQYILDDSDAVLLLVSDEFVGGESHAQLHQLIASIKTKSNSKTGVVAHDRPALEWRGSPHNRSSDTDGG